MLFLHPKRTVLKNRSKKWFSSPSIRVEKSLEATSPHAGVPCRGISAQARNAHPSESNGIDLGYHPQWWFFYPSLKLCYLSFAYLMFQTFSEKEFWCIMLLPCPTGTLKKRELSFGRSWPLWPETVFTHFSLFYTRNLNLIFHHRLRPQQEQDYASMRNDTAENDNGKGAVRCAKKSPWHWISLTLSPKQTDFQQTENKFTNMFFFSIPYWKKCIFAAKYHQKKLHFYQRQYNFNSSHY